MEFRCLVTSLIKCYIENPVKDWDVKELMKFKNVVGLKILIEMIY